VKIGVLQKHHGDNGVVENEAFKLCCRVKAHLHDEYGNIHGDEKVSDDGNASGRDAVSERNHPKIILLRLAVPCAVEEET